MHDNFSAPSAGYRLVQFGVLLFFAGLLTGFVIPFMENPRIGLSSHLEGVLNGIFLMVLGLVWPRLNLGMRTERVAFSLALFGTFANWIATLLGGIWGAGGMMPIASGGQAGSTWQEVAVGGLLISLSVAMLAVCPIVLIGLRAARKD